MLAIPGINHEKALLFGEKLTKLVKNARLRYEEIKAQDYRPKDPNHNEVILLSSDDERGDGDVSDDEDIRSPYFQQPPEVESFNGQCKLSALLKLFSSKENFQSADSISEPCNQPGSK